MCAADGFIDCIHVILANGQQSYATMCSTSTMYITTNEKNSADKRVYMKVINNTLKHYLLVNNLTYLCDAAAAAAALSSKWKSAEAHSTDVVVSPLIFV